MGWNNVAVLKESPLMRGIDDTAEFYFAHAYHFASRVPSDMLCETSYGIDFTSAVQKDNVFGVQFHPEKSHDSGARLLKNFIEL
jgi:glutamine amidotransferase